MNGRWAQILYLLYCAEAGIYLVLVPWSALWNRMVLHWAGQYQGILMSGTARGSVSALGFLVLSVGVVDLARFCRILREAAP